MSGIRPRLLILSFSRIVADARVLKQVRHFSQHYDVTTCGYGENPGSGVTHVQIPDDAPFGKHRRRDLILRTYASMYRRIPAVVAAREGLRAHERFDIVLADDIDTVGLALELAPRMGVHADIHEYAPKQNEELPMWRLFIAPYIRWMCRGFLRRANSVTTVGHGVADEYRRVYGIDAGIVTNAAPYAQLSPTAVSSPLRLVHSGAALRNRHLEIIIDAVEASTQELTLDLFLMPNDPAYIAELRESVAGSTRVTVREPVDYSQLLATLNDFDLGIHVIPPVNFNNAWSLPNKFFDYVQARLGLVIGPSAEMRENLEAYDLGVTADAFDAAAVARTLDALEPADVARWKQNSNDAAHALSAEEQVKVWDDAIAAIAGADRD